MKSIAVAAEQSDFDIEQIQDFFIFFLGVYGYPITLYNHINSSISENLTFEYIDEINIFFKDSLGEFISFPIYDVVDIKFNHHKKQVEIYGDGVFEKKNYLDDELISY